MGKKVVIKKVTVDIILPDGRVVKERDKSLIANLYALAGAKVATPEDALTAAKVKTKIVNLDLIDKDEDDLILEDGEFNYINGIVDPTSGNYPAEMNIGAWIAPLIEMFRSATDINLKEDDKQK